MTQENQEEREGQRENALKILKSPLYVGLANPYLVEKSNHDSEIKQAVHDTIYLPTLEKSGSLLASSLIQSRENGQRYTGHLTENQLINSALKIRQEALASIKVEDVLALAGSNKSVKPEYDSVYIGDLFQTNQELATNILGSYQRCSVTETIKKVMPAIEEAHRRGLEELVCEIEGEENN